MCVCSAYSRGGGDHVMWFFCEFSAFVLCEYLLSWDGVYPEFVSMVTTTTAAVMFWRYV